MATGVSIPLRGLEGIPGLPGASQDEAVRTRKFEVSHGGGATLALALCPQQQAQFPFLNQGST